MLAGRFKDPQEVKVLGFIASFPRFQKEAFEHNMKLVNHVESLAKEKGCTPAQLAIAWVHGQGKRPGRPTIIPIPGATTVERVKENSKLIELTEEEVKKIDTIVESFDVAGARYPPGVPIST